MKIARFLCLILIAVAGAGSAQSAAAANTEGTATFSVVTASYAGLYNPKNIAVVWVVDSSNRFVKTLCRHATIRIEYLSRWIADRGTYTAVDGTTSATLLSQPQTHAVTWNCRDKNNAVVPDGLYYFKVEYTSEDGPGPYLTNGVGFLKSTAPVTTNFPDVSSSGGQFTGMTLTYVPILPNLSVTPASQPVGFAAGTATFAVSNTGGGTMSYTASEGESWLAITSGGSGSNSGILEVAFDANGDVAARTGTVTVAAPGSSNGTVAVEIVQAGAPPADLSVTPASRSVGFAAGATTFEIGNLGGAAMSYAANEEESWLAITDGGSGGDSGTLTVSFDANGDVAPRTGMVAVAAAGADHSPASVEVVQAGVPPQISRSFVNVRENGEGRFFVRLGGAPSTPATIAVARVSGDANLVVKGGANLVFAATNWGVWQAVTLGAANDADTANGTATIRVAAPGGTPVDVTARELDDDIGLNLALAAGGSAIAGGVSSFRAIDGIHTASGNYGYTVWTSAPPGAMTLDLKVTTTVSRVRVLNYDWAYRFQRYRIESSLNGTTWSSLVDASAAGRTGWEDWSIASRKARYLRFTGLSNSANSAVYIPEWEVYGYRPPLLLSSRSSVNVRENGEGRFFVKLGAAPSARTTVTVSRVSGDANLVVKAGAKLVFASTNWGVWQAVTLGAANDADATSGSASFRLAASGAASVYVTARELDDDIGSNLARASTGSTITGGVNASRSIDGTHTLSGNYGYTTWTSVPPGTMKLDLRGTATVTRVRVLNYDWTYRIHRYRIESSLNGTTWSSLVDASTGSHMGWEDWAIASRKARYLRFTGLSNSANSHVYIPEWEVYGSRPALAKNLAVASVPSAPVLPAIRPATVVTSDDGPEHTNGWGAVDGDPNTMWAGRAGAGGWHIAVGYESTLKMTNLVLDLAEGSLTNPQCLYSLDGTDWSPLPEDWDVQPVSLNYLWVLFPADNSAAVPRVVEISPQQ